VRSSSLQLDSELAKEGVLLSWHFGGRSVAGLARIAEYIQRSVYLAGSFRRTEDGFRFVLLDPPLRLGAFVHLELLVDGRPVPGDRVLLRSERIGAPRSADSVGPVTPIELLPGDPVEFRVRTDPALGGGAHAVRLNLRNQAIPPLVWFEFHDRLLDRPTA
jgi:hypothetical protein